MIRNNAVDATPLLSRHAAIALSGEDALAFAHAQFASAVDALPVGGWQWSAWLDAGGRVRTLMMLGRAGERLLLALLRGGDAIEMCDSLRPFVFRSRVLIEPLAAGRASEAWSNGSTDGVFQSNTGQLSFHLDGRCLHYTSGSDDAPSALSADWRAADILAGQPWLPEDLDIQPRPADIGLKRLAAVRIDKGCYPGQEIVARMHYRGGEKKQLCHVELDDEAAVPNEITLLFSARIGDALHALAILPRDDSARNVPGLRILAKF